MVVEYIRYKIEKSKHNAFIDAYRKASEFLDKSAYCLGYELTHCEEEEENFILRITWTSTEEHLNDFRKSPEFSAFLNLVKPYFNDIKEMNHYQLTEVVKQKK